MVAHTWRHHLAPVALAIELNCHTSRAIELGAEIAYTQTNRQTDHVGSGTI